MSRATPGVCTRVIVAVGPAAPDSPALTTAAQLAQSAGVELAAMFVEDINLLRLAELPFAFEIGTASATMRRLAVSDIERALKRQAEELKRTLAEMALAVQLNWTFRMARGRPVRVLLEAAGEGDLVVLASSAVRTLAHVELAGAMRDALNATLPGTKPRRARPVAAVLQPGTNALRVLAAAQRLAQGRAAGLILFLAGTQDAEFSVLVAGWLGERGITARIMQLPDLVPEQIAKLAVDEKLNALFWPGDGVREMASEVEGLLDTINCPLIVVR